MSTPAAIAVWAIIIGLPTAAVVVGIWSLLVYARERVGMSLLGAVLGFAVAALWIFGVLTGQVTTPLD